MNAANSHKIQIGANIIKEPDGIVSNSCERAFVQTSPCKQYFNVGMILQNIGDGKTICNNCNIQIGWQK